jgi:hypothetical protein
MVDGCQHFEGKNHFLTFQVFKVIPLPFSGQGNSVFVLNTVAVNETVATTIQVIRMVSSRMLRRVALVRTDVSEEPSAFFIRVTRIGELGTT